MTRRFGPRPLEPARLELLLELARRVPSAGFTQAVELLVLTEPAARERFWELASEASWRAASPQAAGLMAAPVVVVPVVDPSAYRARYAEADKASSRLAGPGTGEWSVPYWLVDGAFSVLALLLAAEDGGLGALFSALHAGEQAVLSGLGVPSGRRSVGAVLIGERDPADRPSGSPLRRPRRPIVELVHKERW